MRNRWLPVGVLAGVLFLINVIARLISRFAFDDDPSAQDTVSTVMFLVIGVIIAVQAFRWGRARPLDSWSGDMVAIVTAAMLLTVLVGPFISGDSPFVNGAGAFFAQIWLYLASPSAARSSLPTADGARLGLPLTVAEALRGEPPGRRTPHQEPPHHHPPLKAP